MATIQNISDHGLTPEEIEAEQLAIAHKLSREWAIESAEIDALLSRTSRVIGKTIDFTQSTEHIDIDELINKSNSQIY